MSEISNNETEFSLFYLFEVIRERISTVLVITLISFLLGLVFYYNQEKTYMFENKINLIEKKSFYLFFSLNDLLLDSSDKGQDLSDVIISRKTLMDMFIDKYRNNIEILNVLNSKYKDNLNNKNEIKAYLVNQSKNYRLYEDKITFNSSIEDQDFHYEIIKEIIDNINLSIKSDLIDLVKNRLSNQERSLIKMIAKTESDLKVAKDIYLRDKKIQITQLQEEINIARQIDLRDDILYATTYSSAPKYYRGYAALEAELENLLQRDDDLDISSYDRGYSKIQINLISLNDQLNEIKLNNYVLENIKKIDPFTAISVELLNYTKTANYLDIFKVTLASILFGLIFSIITILLYTGYVQYNIRDKDSLT